MTCVYLACVASVSVKQRAKNGFSAFCPREKWGESKNRKERAGEEPPPPAFNCFIYRRVYLCSRTAQKRLLRRLVFILLADWLVNTSSVK